MRVFFSFAAGLVVGGLTSAMYFRWAVNELGLITEKDVGEKDGLF